mmetsp:Transcript_26957/g.64721  ORF Transcript_26957/g.64721 Transcript_26957/m.64721 type:complete len:254 (+) Transcript_26957:856-1617(+)
MIEGGHPRGGRIVVSRGVRPSSRTGGFRPVPRCRVQQLPRIVRPPCLRSVMIHHDGHQVLVILPVTLRPHHHHHWRRVRRNAAVVVLHRRRIVIIDRRVPFLERRRGRGRHVWQSTLGTQTVGTLEPPQLSPRGARSRSRRRDDGGRVRGLRRRRLGGMMRKGRRMWMMMMGRIFLALLDREGGYRRDARVHTPLVVVIMPLGPLGSGAEISGARGMSAVRSRSRSRSRRRPRIIGGVRGRGSSIILDLAKLA